MALFCSASLGQGDLQDIFRLAGGGGHTCALDTNLVLRCWGRNDFGQLGIGHTTNRASPTIVRGFTDDLLAVEAGGSHTCALTSNDFDLYCWGANDQGQLGDGTTTDRLKPTLIPAAGDALTVATGVFHTCSIDLNGIVSCWGRNVEGQLGDGSSTDRSSPVAVSGLGAALEIYVGGSHSCALTLAGGVQCWGSNEFGQLGDGSTTDSNVPVAVPGVTGVREISAGLAHTCARLNDNSVQCWGAFPGPTPMAIAGFTDIRSLFAGAYHQCAITNAGAALCVGYNAQGQIGDGSTTDRMMPVGVSGLSMGVSHLGAGGAHTCAALDDGSVRCWGANDSGQLARAGGGS